MGIIIIICNLICFNYKCTLDMQKSDKIQKKKKYDVKQHTSKADAWILRILG